MRFLSEELKARLIQITEEDYKQEENKIEPELADYKALLLKIAQIKKFDFLLWMEGTDQTELSKDEKQLNMLERANLIKGQTKYTDHNVYRQYELTRKGAEIAEKIGADPQLLSQPSL